VIAYLESLRALVLAMMAQLSPTFPPDAPAIADAAAIAVLMEDRPVLATANDDLAAIVTFAKGESDFAINPRPQSADAISGQSCGPWQIPCALARRYTLVSQARYWLALLAYSARVCPRFPAAVLCSGRCDRGRVVSAARLRVARGLVGGGR
jgi:hypothetical protein